MHVILPHEIPRVRIGVALQAILVLSSLFVELLCGRVIKFILDFRRNVNTDISDASFRAKGLCETSVLRQVVFFANDVKLFLVSDIN